MEAFYNSIENSAKNQTFAGCGTFTQKNKGLLNFDTSVLLALEGGMRWRLNSTFSLFTGVFFDYGLSNAFKTQNKFIKYDRDNPRAFSTNSIASIEPDPLKLMAVGFKLRLSIER